MPLLRTALSTLLPALLVSLPLEAQIVGGRWDEAWNFPAEAEDDLMGWSVCTVGDQNGDGVADVLAGAPDAGLVNGTFRSGAVYTFSGATGELLWRRFGDAASDSFGYSLSGAGDVDGDGVEDLIVGAYMSNHGPGMGRAGSAYLFSGATHGLLRHFVGEDSWDWFGYSVSGAGDVDLDGYDDVIIGAPTAGILGRDHAGIAYVYSGATGGLIHRLIGPSAGDELGKWVSGLGDVNGDGFANVLAGSTAWGADGAFAVFSGATGQPLWQVSGTASHRLGVPVTGIGDFDGDGIRDVAAGAPDSALTGQADVYSGLDGSLLWRFDGFEDGSRFGAALSGGADLDADGIADLVIGAPDEDASGWGRIGAVYAFSGATKDLICRLEGTDSNDHFGSSVADRANASGDGFRELAIGAFGADGPVWTDSGCVYSFALDPFLHLDSEQLSASPGSVVAVTLDFPASEAGSTYALLASGSGAGPTIQGGLEIPLTADKIFNKMIQGWLPPIMQDSYGVLDAAGDAFPSLHDHPALASRVGQIFTLAAISFDEVTRIGRLSSVAVPLEIVP